MDTIRAAKKKPIMLSFEEQAILRSSKEVAKNAVRFEAQVLKEKGLESKLDCRDQEKLATENRCQKLDKYQKIGTEREQMLTEDISGIEQELKKYEELITNQMDEGT